MGISLKFDTSKEAVVLLIVCNNKLMLTKYKFENIWVMATTQGAVLNEGDDPSQKITEVVKEQLGISLVPKYACTVVSYINKTMPDGRVRLTSPIYLLDITEKTKSQIKDDDPPTWLTLEEINESQIIREDDKLIFSRILQKNFEDLILDVVQMGKWGRPKLIAWSVA